MVKTSRWQISHSAGSWSAATVTTYCPGNIPNPSQREVFTVLIYYPVQKGDEFFVRGCEKVVAYGPFLFCLGPACFCKTFWAPLYVSPRGQDSRGTFHRDMEGGRDGLCSIFCHPNQRITEVSSLRIVWKSFLVMFSDQSLLMTSALLWLLASLSALTMLERFSESFPEKRSRRKAILKSLAHSSGLWMILGAKSSSFHFICPEMRDSCWKL